MQDRPPLFSTFLMWLLADLFQDLPEVGDLDKPKLVFFFDEAHLLFTDASKAFLQSITQTVRLIRSKGVGVFFVTQTPKDVPSDVLAQLGNRVQHALRAFTPDDAKALKATVSTFPTSGYDLEQLLTQLGIGEAVVTVLSERGAPTPVAWTRLRAPLSLMGPSDPAAMAAAGRGLAAAAKYGTAGRPRVGVRAARCAAGGPGRSPERRRAPARTCAATCSRGRTYDDRTRAEGGADRGRGGRAGGHSRGQGGRCRCGHDTRPRDHARHVRNRPQAALTPTRPTFDIHDRRTARRLAEDAGFEPARGFPLHAFQACALGHYANPPPGEGTGPARAEKQPPAGPRRICRRPPVRRHPVNSPRAERQQG